MLLQGNATAMFWGLQNEARTQEDKERKHATACNTLNAGYSNVKPAPRSWGTVPATDVSC